MKHRNVILPVLAVSILSLAGCRKNEIQTNGEEVMASAAKHNGEGEEENNSHHDKKGNVYIMSNAPGGNKVMVYDRDANGLLTFAQSYATGGNGTGAGLGSQASLVLDEQGKYLFACNAGSNSISVFKVTGNGLKLIDQTGSHGTMPISIAVNDDLLYVLNAGGNGNISGFQIHGNGDLNYLPGSNMHLSGNSSGPAQISFNPSGTQLVVTEKATNLIDTYRINKRGLPGALVTHPSVGNTPFGFEFTDNSTLIVSDAFGGSPLQSALTSYKVINNGNVNLVTGPVPTHQTAACWVAITDDNQFAYASNAGSNNISGYRIGSSGAITLLDAGGITGVTGGGPNDISLSNGSRYLYSLNASGHSISMFKVNVDGSLTSLGTIAGLPAGSAGMAAD